MKRGERRKVKREAVIAKFITKEGKEIEVNGIRVIEESDKDLATLVKEEIVKYFAERDMKYKQAFEDIKEMFLKDLVDMNKTLNNFREETKIMKESHKRLLKNLNSIVMNEVKPHLASAKKIADAFKIVFSIRDDD